MGEPNEGRPWRWTLFVDVLRMIGLGFVVLYLLLMLMPWGIEAMIFLLFGWLWYLFGVVPQLTTHWGMVTLLIIALAVFVYGADRCGRW